MLWFWWWHDHVDADYDDGEDVDDEMSTMMSWMRMMVVILMIRLMTMRWSWWWWWDAYGDEMMMLTTPRCRRRQRFERREEAVEPGETELGERPAELHRSSSSFQSRLYDTATVVFFFFFFFIKALFDMLSIYINAASSFRFKLFRWYPKIPTLNNRKVQVNKYK